MYSKILWLSYKTSNQYMVDKIKLEKKSLK